MCLPQKHIELANCWGLCTASARSQKLWTLCCRVSAWWQGRQQMSWELLRQKRRLWSTPSSWRWAGETTCNRRNGVARCNKYLRFMWVLGWIHQLQIAPSTIDQFFQLTSMHQNSSWSFAKQDIVCSHIRVSMWQQNSRISKRNFVSSSSMILLQMAMRLYDAICKGKAGSCLTCSCCWASCDLMSVPRNVFHSIDFLLQYSPLIREKAQTCGR